MVKIHLDGDDYIFRIPLVTEWDMVLKALRQYHKKKGFLGDPLKEDVFLAMYKNNWALIMDSAYAEEYSDQEPQKHCLYRVDNDGAGVVEKKTTRSFLPCLVPLDKNGRSIEKLFARNNPDGTLVYGGELWRTYDGKREPNLVKRPQNGAPIRWTEEQMLRIMDTQTNPIEWIVLEGRLFATKPIFRAATNELEQILTFF